MNKQILILFLILFPFSTLYAADYDECINAIHDLVKSSCSEFSGKEKCRDYGIPIQKIAPEALYEIYPEMCRRLDNKNDSVSCIQKSLIENEKVNLMGCQDFVPTITTFENCKNKPNDKEQLDCYIKSIKQYAFEHIYAE